MKNKFYLLCASVVVLIFFSCNQSASTLAVYVPKDASAVFVIDAKSITDKLTSSGLSLGSLANVFEAGNDSMPVKWEDIKNSGIDLDKPFYVFSRSSNAMQSKYNGGGLIAEVANAAKLEAFLMKKKTGGNIATEGNYKYVKLHDDCVAGFTDKVLIVTAFKAEGSGVPDTLAQNQLKQMFTQKEDESVASLDAFKSTFKKAGDIHFYANTASGLDKIPMAGMTRANDLLEDSYTDGVINFEKGKILAEGQMHYNKTLADIIDKYPQQEIKMDMIKSYPKPLTGFGVIAFNPKLLVDILRYLGFDTMADGFTSNIGFTTNDVVNAFSGDIAIMFSASPQKNSPGNSLKDGSFLTVANVGDKAAFDKVMNALLSKGLLSKNGNTYQLGLAGGHGFVIEAGSDKLFISSSDELVKSFQSSAKNENLPAGIEKEINGKTMAAYLDINTFLQNATEGDSVANEVAKSAAATFKNFVMFADKEDDKTIGINYELNLINENENSLASMARFMAIAKKAGIKHKKEGTANPPLSNFPDSLQTSKDSGVAQ